MSVHEHKEHAPKRPLNVWVVVVSSSRTEATDQSGALIASLLSDAGHKVLDRTVVDDDVEAIRTLVRGLAGEGTTQVVILTGGTGLSARDLTPEAIEPLYTRAIPGFGELFRVLSFYDVGAAALSSRATAGVIGDTLVFAMPGSPEACRLGMEGLVLPELHHMHHQVTKEGAAASPGVQASVAPMAAKESPKAPEPEAAKPELPAPSGGLGQLGRNRISVGADQSTQAEAAPAAEEGEVPTGWLRAVYEIRGEVVRGTYPEIPEEVANIAPIVDVLHASGERGTLTLPSGRVYTLFGYPDLVSKGSKVLAIGDGTPVGEVLALHRYPVKTGSCVDQSFGLMPKRHEDVARVAEAVTGRVPKDASGQLFAVQGDAVWIQRGTRAIRWDGTRERDDGTLKQVLATLVLDWSRR